MGVATLLIGAAACSSSSDDGAPAKPLDEAGAARDGDLADAAPPAAPAIPVDVEGPASVLAGESVTLKLFVTRDGATGFGGPVHIEVGASPDIVAGAIDIPANQRTATIEVTAAPGRKHGRVDLSVTATSPGAPNTGGAVYSLLVRGPAGSVDNGFGTDGVVTLTALTKATGLVADGRRVFVGGQSGADAAIAALTEDGQNDTTFGAVGVYKPTIGTVVGTSELAGSVALGLFLGATVNTGTRGAATITASNGSGIRLPGFGVNGTTTAPLLQTVTALALAPKDSTGKARGIMVGGQTDPNRSASEVQVIGLDGKVLTSSFGASLVPNCPNGDLECIGRGLAAGTDAPVAAWCGYNENGSLVVGGSFDATPINANVGTSLYIDRCTSVAYGKGKLYVGGNSSNLAAVSRYVDGALDDTWPPGPSGQLATPFAPESSGLKIARRIFLQADDTVIVAADAMVDGHGAFGAWRLKTDGTADTAFASPKGTTTKSVGVTDVTVTTAAIDGEGRLVVLGSNGKPVLTRFWQ